MAKKQQTKTTKHTIEFSNNRPALPLPGHMKNPTAEGREKLERTVEHPDASGLFLGMSPRSPARPCRVDSQ